MSNSQMQLWLGSALEAIEKSNGIRREIRRRHVFCEQTALGDLWVRRQARNCPCVTWWNSSTKKERLQFNKGKRMNIRNLQEQQQDNCKVQTEVSRKKPCWAQLQLCDYMAGEGQTSHLKCYGQLRSSKIHNTSPDDFKGAEIDKKQGQDIKIDQNKKD